MFSGDLFVIFCIDNRGLSINLYPKETKSNYES